MQDDDLELGFGKPWLEVLAHVITLQRRAFAAGSVAWFRGHADSSWTLRSLLHRHVLDVCASSGLPETTNPGLLREVHKSDYTLFRSDAWPFLEADERTDWGVIVAMQHHGHPTRLMDWTESFACALHFAQQRSATTAGAMFVLDPEGLNAQFAPRGRGLVRLEPLSENVSVPLCGWHPKFDVLQSGHIAVVPQMANRRMVAQQSRFVMCGDDYTPLEESASSVIEKIVLPPETFDDANIFLELAVR